jgi:hypothetical protein
MVLGPFNFRLCLSHPRASPGLISVAMPGTLFYSVFIARYSWLGGTLCIARVALLFPKWAFNLAIKVPFAAITFCVPR